MILGFTGTRALPTVEQARWMRDRISEADTLHHGACIGSDALAHRIALELGVNIVVHPPDNPKLLDELSVVSGPLVTVLEPLPYIVRNHQIVMACDEMIATPKEDHEISRSGTWATVRFAIYGLRKSVLICYPSGQLEMRAA